MRTLFQSRYDEFQNFVVLTLRFRCWNWTKNSIHSNERNWNWTRSNHPPFNWINPTKLNCFRPTHSELWWIAMKCSQPSAKQLKRKVSFGAKTCNQHFKTFLMLLNARCYWIFLHSVYRVAAIVKKYISEKKQTKKLLPSQFSETVKSPIMQISAFLFKVKQQLVYS